MRSWGDCAMSGLRTISQIKGLIATGALAEAERALVYRIGVDERDLDAHLLLAEFHGKSGNWQAAHFQWKRIRRLFENDPCWETGLLQSARRTNDWQTVDELLPRLKEKNGETREYFEILSDKNRALGLNDEAIRVNRMMIEAFGEDYWSVYRIADSYILKHAYDDAEKSFKRAVEIDPAAPFAYERLAYIAYRRGDLETALSTLRANLDRAPDHVWTLDHLLKPLILAGDYAEARAVADVHMPRQTPNGAAIIERRLSELDRNIAFERKVMRNESALRDILGGSTFTDVGAADGFQWQWTILARLGFVKAVGFEPDEAECTALNGLFPFASFIPYAVGAQDGPATFHITDVMSCSSLLEPDLDVLQRFPIRSCFEVVRRLSVSIRSIESMIEEGLLQPLTFLKVDVQGAEYDILKGLGPYLDNVLAMELETQILRIYKDQRTLCDLIDFLGAHGFRLRGVEPQGTFEGEVVEIEAFFTKQIDCLSREDRRRVFAWEAITGCPQLPMMGDNPEIQSYPRLRRTLTDEDVVNAAMRREVRGLFD